MVARIQRTIYYRLCEDEETPTLETIRESVKKLN
jgi:hypothetical protein